MTDRLRGDEARRVDGFDGLRACAALLVVAYHAGLTTGASKIGALAPVVSELKAGVAVFFVISGFLLYLPCARAIRERRPLPDWRGYAARRAARILPGYWVALTLIAAAGLAPFVFSHDWWRFYGLAQIYQGWTLFHGLGPAWSLAVELSFYLLLPFFALGMCRVVARRSGPEAVRAQLMTIAGVALWSLALRASLAGSVVLPVPLAHISLATSIAGTADWFAAGMALATLRAEWEAGSTIAPWLRTLAAHPGACWLLALLAYLVGVPLQHGELFLPLYGVSTHVAIALAAAFLVLPAVLPARRAERTGPMRLLQGRQLTWLGTISYGIYLWHLPFLFKANQWLGAPHGALGFAALFTAAAIGAVCLGAASWYLIERPVQSWVRRRLSLRAQRPGTVVTARSVEPSGS